MLSFFQNELLAAEKARHPDHVGLVAEVEKLKKERDEIQARLDRQEDQQTSVRDVRDMPIVSEIDHDEDLNLGLDTRSIDVICEALTEAGIDFDILDI